MNNKKAFVDTTILTDILLKPSGKGKIAKEALSKYDQTDLPVYAIKEFKAGPLSNFKWMHNKLVTTGSWSKSLEALHVISRSLHRYKTSTSIEALKEAAEEIGKYTPQKLVEKYGAKASMDSIQCDAYRLSIKTLIYKAWKRRRKVTTAVTHPLICYKESDPFEIRGLIELKPTKCNPEKECCLGPQLRSSLDHLKALKDIIENASVKEENTKRNRILKEIIRKPKQSVSEEYCRGLGDAYFALFCPNDAVILTTNIADHKPLANSLNKDAETPAES